MGCLSSKETTIKEPTFTEEVVTVAAGKVVREKPTTNYKKVRGMDWSKPSNISSARMASERV